jgi:hypothetical protein
MKILTWNLTGGFDTLLQACPDGSAFAHRVEGIIRGYSTTKFIRLHKTPCEIQLSLQAHRHKKAKP